MKPNKTIAALVVISIAALVWIAWTPSSSSFNTNQFGANNPLISIIDGASVTNLNAYGIQNPSGIKSQNITLTNTLNLIWSPFVGPTNNLDLTKIRQSYTTTTDLNLTNVSGLPPAGIERTVLLSVTNSSGSDITVRYTMTGITTPDGTRSAVVTNKTQRKFSFNADDQGLHLVTQPFF